MRRFLFIYPFIFLSMIIASCSSDDDIQGGEKPAEDIVTYNDLSYFQNAIIEVDSLGNFMGRVCGEVLNEDEPSHLYVGVESVDEAKQMFLQWIAPDVDVTPTANGLSAPLTDLDGKAQGTVYFADGTQSGHVAEVTASAGTKLLYFHQLTFLLNSAWPVNASAKIFHQGDVITHSPYLTHSAMKDADVTLKWVCIRESGNGQKPMFTTVTKEKYECGSGPQVNYKQFNAIRTSTYCPAESKANFISKTLRGNWDFWYPIFKEQGIPLDGGENYWIDMTHWTYFDAINLPSGEKYGYHEHGRRPFLLKIDWLDDDEIYSNLAGTAGSTSHEYEGYERLFDGINSTKWCSAWQWRKDGIWYVEFSGNIALKPVGYKLTTASDTEKYPGRNPKVWRLLARNDAEDEWVEIAKETNGGLPAINGYTKSYSIANPKKYMYYRWEISECNTNNDTMQISRFSFVF